MPKSEPRAPETRTADALGGDRLGVDASQPSREASVPVAGTPPGWFEIQDSVSAGRHELVLSGELDLASADRLKATLEGICSGATGAVTIDLSRVSFIDSTGLHALLAAQKLCEEHGCAFSLTPGPPAVQRLFELTGVLEVLPFQERLAGPGVEAP